ncbi:DUF6538 domain-containing protein [Rubellimicrobium aerolatum]|uniref:DUF6538 domain-containing protein n=1 Tax=Rubellimicrobium aerolatum TaxID=490979 RepID=A0ABW0SHB8_9RHOB|nr:DUF6538 domain-containing protein [Rubellimicrobium aerolatum]MBP1807695.1 hypothetical protein [Rubellimicrobium aerolatum]
MGLRMATPWKHPTTGAYYLRERVPTDLIATVKGRKVVLTVDGQAKSVTLGETVKVSLGTKEPKRAVVLYRETSAVVQELWTQARQEVATGPVRLTGKQVQALSGLYYRGLVSAHEEDPGSADQWETLSGVAEELTDAPRQAQENALGEEADRLLQQAGLSADTPSRLRLLEEMDHAARKASDLLWMRSKGDYSPDPNASRYPELPPTAETHAPRDGETVTLTDLFDLSCYPSLDHPAGLSRGVLSCYPSLDHPAGLSRGVCRSGRAMSR